MSPRRLILIEFNELCPRLLREFMDRGSLPHFRRLYESSTVFTTDAGEEPPNLEPWIQWPTIHSGMPFGEHQIHHLGNGRKLEHKCVAEVLSDAGARVGIFGSMNLNYRRLNGYVMPDPWDREGRAYPGDLQPFYKTVSRQVQESSRNESGSKKELLRFGWFLIQNGLTASTAWVVVKQLASERRDPGLRWRRACVLDRLQYDVFRRLNRIHNVQFATFFCNSTAHFQHYHWRNMAPESFTVPPPEGDHPSLREAIPYGYQAMDTLIDRFLRDYPDAVLMLCTALSQQPWTDTTKCTFRPRRFEEFLDFAQVNVSSSAIKPVMAEQFHVECPDDDTALMTEQGFRDLAVDDEPLMAVKREGKDIFAGCRVTDAEVVDRPVTRRSDGNRRRFGDLFYMIHTMRSGRHHPDGVLWIKSDRHSIIPERVPLTDIAPTILNHFGVDCPEHMCGKPLMV
ncbi:MAG TPA: hypothetical protein VGZ25_00780 [Gemmataceae bacterium]|nr:hypothetical protein [Gemmataceae bacterium]